MDDRVATAALAGDPAALADLVGQLRAQMAQLREEIAALKQDNVELRQQAHYWQSQHAQARKQINKLQQRLEKLQAENRNLRQQAFGRRGETSTPSNDETWLAALRDDPPGSRQRGQQAGRPGPARRDYQHLPARIEMVELPPAQRCCPRCGQAYVERHDSEDSELIEIEVHAYRRVLRRRRYQPQCRCTGPWRIVTAAAPPKLLPKGRYGISVWVEILLGKFASQRPTERLLAQWKLSGLDLAAGTVTGGLQRLEPLFVPLYEALVARPQQARYWQADETRWYVFADQEGKVGHRWWLWVFVSEDCTVFYLDPRRSRRVPQEHLPQRLGQVDSGVMMVDRFACYKAIAQVKKGEVVLVYCGAHVRRDFVRLGLGFPELRGWSLDWLRHIRRLYRLYQQRKQAYAQVSDSPAAADQEVRQHLQSMQQEARMQLAEPSLRRPCRKVLKSLQEHWEGLTRFADDPSIPLDNNACERQLRGPALGRKNYYGSGALWSGRLAAMLFSLLGTLERSRINPRQWLTDYLQACAAAGGRPPPNLDPWLPWQYQPTTMPTAPASNPG